MPALDLIPILKKIANELQKKGMLPAGEMNHLVKQVAEQLKDANLKKDDLKDKNIQKALSLSLIAEHIGSKNKKYKFNYRILFDKELSDDQDKFKLTLKNELKKLLLELNKLNPQKKFTEKAIDDLCEKLARDLTKKFWAKSSQKCIAENNTAVDATAELLGLALKNLYGVDPRFAGGQAIPVLNIIGNLTGIVQYQAHAGTSNAFIDELNRFDTKPDPLGIENSIRLRLDQICGKTLEDDLLEIASSPPRLKPPGTDISRT